MMKHLVIGSLALLLSTACGDNLTPPADPDAAPEVDALVPPPPDAAVPDAFAGATLGPSLVFDDIHIAGFLEDAHAFSLLGQVLNPQLEMSVQNGTLLLGIELRDLADPSGGTDEDLTVGLYFLGDSDGDPTDNFDADDPELFLLGPGSIIMGEPALHFTTANIADRNLHAEGVDALDLLGGLLPISNVMIDGDLNAGGEETPRFLEDGRLRGVVGMALLSFVPNLLSGMCEGQSLLDVLATGCGLFPLQPDSDVDGDGLERLYDDDGDGSIDRCVDGDGTEILGTDCPTNPAMADGYELIFVIHGVRALIAE